MILTANHHRCYLGNWPWLLFENAFVLRGNYITIRYSLDCSVREDYEKTLYCLIRLHVFISTIGLVYLGTFSFHLQCVGYRGSKYHILQKQGPQCLHTVIVSAANASMCIGGMYDRFAFTAQIQRDLYGWC